MSLLSVMKERHSVRSYQNIPVEETKRSEILAYAKDLSDKSEISFQIVFDDPNCFDSFMGHYGRFHGVQNYIAIVGTPKKDVDVGFFGEDLVIKLQSMGLNTCWVVLTHGKTKAKIEKGEKLYCVISFGYGTTQGTPHKNKADSTLFEELSEQPKWFVDGVEASLLAPTAMNQQKFYLTREGDVAKLKIRFGVHSDMDAGIVKYHFESVSGHTLEII